MTAGSVPADDDGRSESGGEEQVRERALAALEAELARLDLLCRIALLDWRAERGQRDEFGGLYVSDAEADRLLRTRERAERARSDGTDLTDEGRSDVPDMGTHAVADSASESLSESQPADRGSTGAPGPGRDRTPPERARLVARLAAATRERRVRTERERDDGDRSRSRFVELADRFDLDRRELDALLVALAPAVDGRYRRVYGYLQDDVTRARPSVGLLSRLLFGDGIDAPVRSLVGPTASLVRTGLVRVRGEGPFAARLLSVDDRIVGFLLGEDALPAELSTFTTVTDPTGIPDSHPPADGTDGDGWTDRPAVSALDPAVRASLAESIERSTGREAGAESASEADEGASGTLPLIYLYGPYGVGTAAESTAVCAGAETQLLVADLAEARPTSLDAGVGRTVALLARETCLRDAVVCVRNSEAVAVNGDSGDSDPTAAATEGAVPDDEGRKRGRLATIVAALDTVDGPVVVTGRDPLPTRLQVGLERHEATSVRLPRPEYEDRLAQWRTVDALPADVDATDLASTFRFTPGQIDDAVRTAASIARAAGRPEPTAADVYAGCRAQTGERLASLGRKVEPTYGWDDIVLPPDTAAHLREVAAHVRHRGRVYAEWGFARRFALGRGIVVLFAGPSGTGKTMAAEIVADAVGLELFKIDLSRVVSKYIGETEKNLGAVFDAAEDSNAVLLFDEADALFGKRSQVSDARDRYANVEVNYLLQRVEEYNGVVILTTNFETNIDAAFQRRINHSVDFPLPDEAARRAIWEHIFPPETPVAELDYAFLSSFELAGGAIKNVAVTAALLAADDDEEPGGGADERTNGAATAAAASPVRRSRVRDERRNGSSAVGDGRASEERADGATDAGDAVVGMRHVVRALRREFQKTGTLVDPDEFGTYYELTRPEAGSERHR